mmetsp:Transcript_12755/g.34129  ORF Transcript_12755/g.34129 Transcript_12755/m.34129 type:complete len:210 (+) Transcript_12755:66-695(+)
MAFFGLTALAGIDTDGVFRSHARSVLNVRSKDDWVELFHLFHVYDADGNGMFDVGELKNLLTTYNNREPDDAEVEALAKFLDQNENGLISWDEFVEGVRAATENEAGEIMVPITEYKSSGLFHDDLVKHRRRKTGPQQQFKQPILASHEVGWNEGLLAPVGDTRFRRRTTDLSQFAAATLNASYGKSAGNMGKSATEIVKAQGGFSYGV